MNGATGSEVPPPQDEPPQAALLSERWQDRVRRSGTQAPLQADAVVIGSGYGASVAALRLAAMGWQVTVLERGGELRPGDFPEDAGLALPALRGPLPEGRGVLGNPAGLYELRVGPGMAALTGNGLGGGSLVNAGVLMRPEDEVLAQAAWPDELRQDLRALDEHFARAAAELGSHSAADLPGLDRLPKAAALRRLARGLPAVVQVAPVNFTVNPERCTQCGDCAAGCNVPGAKLTLRDTYLRRAVAQGAQLFTGATVYTLQPEAGALGLGRRPAQAPRWRLRVMPTDRVGHYRSEAEAATLAADGGAGVDLLARLVVVGAGALGSTELLQRSQARAQGRFWLSPALGTRVSANGDSLSFSADEPVPVQAVGLGADTWQRSTAGAGVGPVGPTITLAADLRQPGRPLERRLLVEEGAVPGAIGRLFAELLAATRLVQTMDGLLPEPPRDLQREPLSAGHWLHPTGGHLDPAASLPQRTQVLLTMGHDGAQGRLLWQPDRDASVPFWEDPQDLPTYREQARVLPAASRQAGGRWVPSPLWQALPQPVLDLMEGWKPRPLITTVHPLGGCPMGDDPRQGVVDSLGRVWRQEEAVAPEREAERHYRNLLVVDGAILPTALGCNPLWTITALAERALANPDLPRLRLELGHPGPPLLAQPQPGRPPLRRPWRRHAPVRLPVDMLERLTAADLPARGALAASLAAISGGLDRPPASQAPGLHAELRLSLSARSGDWLALWDDPMHRLQVRGQLRLEPAAPPG
ncbi:GMC oxidoreductase, partial [Ideonella livida]